MSVDGLTNLADAAYSDEILSNAVEYIDASELSVFGSEHESIAALRSKLHATVHASAGKLEIVLISKYPHEASRVVDGVIEALLSQERLKMNRGQGLSGLDQNAIYRAIPANPDVGPIGASPELLMALAAAFGLVLGIAIVLIRATLDRRVASPSQILRMTGLQTAGYLPSLSRRASPAAQSLAAHIDPTSEVAISCRALLMNLLGGEVSQQRGSVLITSPSRGEGRSTVVLNLAATLALTGECVLLVDADMRCPIQHKLLTQPESLLGFCEALDNPTAAAEFVCSTHVPNLFLLPCGKPSSSAAARLQGRAVTDVIHQLRSAYRYVLFDAGPVLENPDTVALAARSNATILVLSAKRTNMEKAVEAAIFLRTSRSEVEGRRGK